MSACPDYRIRLFLSVDLAGSTAFKNGPGRDGVDGNESYPRWVEQIRTFYRTFPPLIAQEYQRVCTDPARKGPQVWKTIGDEIVFVCRVHDLRHVGECCQAFLKALRVYGERLDQAGKHLDIKGAGWTAAFPTPNVTVSLIESAERADQFDEDYEARADHGVGEFDFLGPSIDAGFRLAGQSRSDRMVVSAELGLILGYAEQHGHFHGTFSFHGRHVLKGVIKDRPYPIVSIDSERSPSRKVLRHQEDQLAGRPAITSDQVSTFLLGVLEDERIDPPSLPGTRVPHMTAPPRSYARFADAWQVTLQREQARADVERESATASDESASPLQSEIIEQADAITDALPQQID